MEEGSKSKISVKKDGRMQFVTLGNENIFKKLFSDEAGELNRNGHHPTNSLANQPKLPR